MSLDYGDWRLSSNEPAPIIIEFNNTVGYTANTFNRTDHGSAIAMKANRSKWALDYDQLGLLHDVNNASNTLLPGPNSHAGIIDNMIYWDEGVQSRNDINDILGVADGKITGMYAVYPSTEYYFWTGSAWTGSQVNTSASGWFQLTTGTPGVVQLGSNFTSKIKYMSNSTYEQMTKD